MKALAIGVNCAKHGAAYAFPDVCKPVAGPMQVLQAKDTGPDKTARDQ